MSKHFLLICVLAFGFGAVTFAAPDPAFYRQHKTYLSDNTEIKVIDGKIYVKDAIGWFTVECIEMDYDGVFCVTVNQ